MFRSKDAPADGRDNADANPLTPDSEDKPDLDREGGAVSALDVIRIARAAGAKLMVDGPSLVLEADQPAAAGGVRHAARA